jgi:hypothetical protein
MSRPKESAGDRPSASAMEDYLGRVNGLVISLMGILDAEELDRAQHLIDHGEPAEGVARLAWIIVQNDRYVSASVVASIRELSEGLVAEEDLPADLSSHVLP